MQLLARARNISPNHFEAGFDLARLRAKMGDSSGAWRLFEELVRIATRRQRRRIRGAQLRLWPAPSTACRWLRTAVFGR